MMSMGTLHRSYAVSGAVATAGAAMIRAPWSASWLGKRPRQDLCASGTRRVIDVGAVIEPARANTFTGSRAGADGRRLMEGHVLVRGAVSINLNHRGSLRANESEIDSR